MTGTISTTTPRASQSTKQVIPITASSITSRPGLLSSGPASRVSRSSESTPVRHSIRSFQSTPIKKTECISLPSPISPLITLHGKQLHPPLKETFDQSPAAELNHLTQVNTNKNSKYQFVIPHLRFGIQPGVSSETDFSSFLFTHSGGERKESKWTGCDLLNPRCSMQIELFTVPDCEPSSIKWNPLVPIVGHSAHCKNCQSTKSNGASSFPCVLKSCLKKNLRSSRHRNIDELPSALTPVVINRFCPSQLTNVSMTSAIRRDPQPTIKKSC